MQEVVPNGWDNRTFRLGQEMLVRLPSAGAYAAQVEKEQKWLPRLASQLLLAIPEPIALGNPSAEYPWAWSVYRWLEGEVATRERVQDFTAFATDLANFLNALQQVDAGDTPLPGRHNFFRGGSLLVYDAEVEQALHTLKYQVDVPAAQEVWQKALQSNWEAKPVWVHGDVSPTNLLVQDGKLSAVIDLGCCGVGDPACDLTMAWTFFTGESRDAFKTYVHADAETWARARGWGLWKALITLAEYLETDPQKVLHFRRVIDAILGTPL